MTIDLTYFLVPVMLFALAVMLKKNKFTFKIGNQPILIIVWKLLSIAMFFLTFWAIYKHDYKYLHMHREILFNGITPVMFLALIETSFNEWKRK